MAMRRHLLARGYMRATHSVHVHRALCMRRMGVQMTVSLLLLLLLWLRCLRGKDYSWEGQGGVDGGSGPNWPVRALRSPARAGAAPRGTMI